MSVLNLTPYQYKVTQSPAVIKDENGHPKRVEDSGPTVSPLYDCYMVPATGEASDITLEDGTKVAYSNTIYGDASSPDINIGMKIEVLDKKSQAVVFTGIVKGVRHLTNKTKIWV